MRTPRVVDPRVCSIDAALKVIGEKWALLALRELLLGSTRFDEIVSNTGAPRDRLSARLRALEEAGVVRREKYQERPVRYSYHLTEAGEQLFGLLQLMRDWGDRFVRDDPEYMAVFTHECGKPLRPELRCAECGEVVQPGSVTTDRDVHQSDVVNAGRANGG
ncbi:transcriptional regulator [Kibdelosporangium aridum]|uniref:Transcriptional regulator n=1 Tax=Kibdelosporangium aridum TaxID=2030 RepID=A0A428ZH39_KIBAR|nr:transcriptional regulator [Kibdelosporangium aridum]